MSDTEEMVEVCIQATERIEYFQTVRMPKSEFERLYAAMAAGDSDERRRAQGEIEGGWINTGDVCGTDDFQLETFEIVGASPASCATQMY